MTEFFNDVNLLPPLEVSKNIVINDPNKSFIQSNIPKTCLAFNTCSSKISDKDMNLHRYENANLVQNINDNLKTKANELKLLLQPYTNYFKIHKVF